ncbi:MULTISPECIES: alpha/beta hydrolase [unclassified Nonomuraea]|uniref:alpha/beta hydrolase n=1 Tax=unclassified Nonomuraea TaxID=2593643 RepID=UPI001485C5D7|nr:alpha/beta hydrolase [Nonomuraea sp. KC401]
MNRVVRIIAGTAVLVAGTVSADGTAVAGAARSAPAVVAAVAWGPCPQAPGKPAPAELECATVRVPLDYREPRGHQIKVAINRIKAKTSRDADHLGTLLVNPGGPGASGRNLTSYVARNLPGDLRDRYDIVGFDPRGVGASEPAMRCVDPAAYYKAPRPDAVPRGRAEERVLLSRAAAYANACGNRWAWLLPHLTTENSARDMDTIRAALGEQKISYLGYSYGTYLGAVYATLFPQRVKRLVLDSVVDPTTVWYESNLRQNGAFERRHRLFLGWAAEHNSVYRLGATTRQTLFAYYAMRDRLRERPAGGIVGPSELDDTFTITGYSDKVWPAFAAAWSAYVRKGEVQGLVDLYNKHGKVDAADENSYAVYLGVQCRDARWPRDWDKWRADMTRSHRSAPFLTWPNAWYNAPCAFWPVRGGEPVNVRGSAKLPPILILQSRDDAATPYRGALTMHRLFPRSRLVVEQGGNHGVSLGGNQCVDGHLSAYLSDGSLPARDAGCRALPEPSASARMAAESRERHDLLGSLGLLGLLGGR